MSFFLLDNIMSSCGAGKLFIVFFVVFFVCTLLICLCFIAIYFAAEPTADCNEDAKVASSRNSEVSAEANSIKCSL